SPWRGWAARCAHGVRVPPDSPTDDTERAREQAFPLAEPCPATAPPTFVPIAPNTPATLTRRAHMPVAWPAGPRGVSTVDRPEIILAPGPTPIPPEVLLAQGSPLVYHRGPGFGKLMRDVTDRLRQLYRTEDADILLMTSSGTGGLESAIQNCFSPGDEVFVPNAGFFADRWKRLAEAFGLTVRTVDYEWGAKIRPEDVAATLAEHPVKAVLLTQSETSTGVIQPIEQLARVANDAGALV